MAGQLIRRGERTWLCRVYLGSDSQTGKRRYLNHTVRGTKRDAQTWLNAALKRKDLGEAIEQSQVSCREFFDEWLEGIVRQRVRENSYDLYAGIIRRYILPAIGNRRLSSITPADIQRIYGAILGRGLSTKTATHAHTVIKNAFKVAVRWQYLRSSPAALVDAPHLERREMRALSATDARRMLAAVVDDQHRIVLTLALASGCRPSEYTGLRWTDLDWSAGTITVQRSILWRNNGTWYITEPKTTASRRRIPLPKPLLAELASHRKRQAEWRMMCGSDWEANDFVFTRYNGAPVRLRALRLSLDRALKAGGLPRVRLYDLRHSCASILMAEGLNPKVVAERLGHSNISMTLAVYSHTSPGLHQEATDRLEKALFG